ncbi:glycosyltransferase family 61 protein [Algoriphagus sediminis]|uniref:Glycosyltransferase family 61 protein n=1 Tax=Algoriphagus sediminis TaxID=3057113 RepID=A0ABT7YFU5_9BACT|nr:glycosyltransferase family 61 protein [Algoriphagus sediminis]MDN3205362.1 glycosyltransferase family 61 protein [Algoriphagus sediminis]
MKKVNVKRKLPENLDPGDKKLFEPALNATFSILPILELENVAILQDTVFDPKKFKFYSEHTHTKGLGFLPIGKRILHCSIRKWRTVDHAMWVKDEWSANYFHWLTDCLPRIWEGMRKSEAKKVLLLDSFKQLPFVTQSLKLIGLEPEFYSSNENIWVKKLVLTSRTATFPNFNVPLTQLTRDKLRKNSEKAPHRKIYISRRFAPKRKSHNAKDVELLVKKYGFEVIYAEKMSLKKQIELMSETETLVCLHGAALTNMLFLPDNASVVELRNVGDSINQCYFNLASALNLKYYYTLNKGDSKNTISTNFTIDLESLEEVLQNFQS